MSAINSFNTTNYKSQQIDQATPQYLKSTEKVETYFKLVAPVVAARPTEHFEVSFKTLEDFGLDTLEDVGSICPGLKSVQRQAKKIIEIEEKIAELETLITKIPSLQQPNELQKNVIAPARKIMTSILNNTSASNHYPSPLSDHVNYENNLSSTEEFQQEPENLKKELEQAVQQLSEITQGDLRKNPANLQEILSSVPTTLKRFSSFLEKLTNWEIQKIVIEIKSYTRQFNIRRIWECNHGIGIETLNSLQKQLELEPAELFSLNNLCTSYKELKAIQSPIEQNIESSNAEIQVSPHLDYLPDELIVLILIHLIEMQAYNPWAVACVSKRLKNIVEDPNVFPNVLSNFLNNLSKTMNTSQEILQRTLERIILRPNSSTEKPVPLLHNPMTIKLRLFQNAQIEKAICSGDILFPSRLGTIQLNKMLCQLESGQNPDLIKRPLDIALEHMEKNDLLSALLALNSIEEIKHKRFIKFLKTKEKLIKDNNKLAIQFTLEVLRKTLDSINKIPENGEKSRALEEISLALLKAGLFAESERVANTIPASENGNKARALEKISLALLKTEKADKFVEAERVANTIPASENGNKARALEEISLTLLKTEKADKFAEAERVANAIPASENGNKARALEEISLTLLKTEKADKFAEAERVANTIPASENGNKAKALEKISIALLRTDKADKFAEAERVANTIPASEHGRKAGALEEISLTLLKAGEFAEAERVANTIPESENGKKARALETISLALLKTDKADKFAEAGRVANTIPASENGKKASALEEISLTLLKTDKADKFAEAERVANTIPESENRKKTRALEKISLARLKAEKFAKSDDVI